MRWAAKFEVGFGYRCTKLLVTLIIPDRSENSWALITALIRRSYDERVLRQGQGHEITITWGERRAESRNVSEQSRYLRPNSTRLHLQAEWHRQPVITEPRYWTFDLLINRCHSSIRVWLTNSEWCGVQEIESKYLQTYLQTLQYRHSWNMHQDTKVQHVRGITQLRARHREEENDKQH